MAESFQETLREIAAREISSEQSQVSIAVTIDAGVLNALLAPHANNVHSTQGLSFEDLTGIMRIAGADANVMRPMPIASASFDWFFFCRSLW